MRVCSRRRAGSFSLRLVIWTAALTLSAVLAAGGSLTQSAFTGRITDSTNTVGITVQDTCRSVQSASSATIAYALTGQSSAEDNLVTTSTTYNGTYYNYSSAASSTTTPMGCTLDSPVAAFITGGTRFLYSNTTVPSVTSTSTVTEEIWFKTTTASGMLMGIGDSQSGVNSNASGKKGLVVFLTSAGKLDFGTYDGTNHEILTSASYLDGKWHDVMAVYNKGSKVLYVDGVSVGSATGTSESLSSCYWRIGADSLTGWSNGGQTGTTMLYFNGSLQYASYYTRALTATDAANHYNAGT